MRPTMPSKKVAASTPGRTWLKIAVVVVLGIVVVKTLSWLARPDRPQPAQPSDQAGQSSAAAADHSPAVGQGLPSESNPGVPADAGPAVADGSTKFPEPMKFDACTSFGAELHLPSDTRVIAVAAAGGRKTRFRIDSGAEATQIEVAVNSPDHPVVMMVTGTGPTIWDFGLTAGTKVLAVLASGKSRQAIAGLDRNTPTLASTGEGSFQCGYFTIEQMDIRSVNPIALHVFQRPAYRAYLGSGDSVVVGDPIPDGIGLARSAETAPESFREPVATPPAAAVSQEK